jgi:hypothetical protein
VWPELRHLAPETVEALAALLTLDPEVLARRGNLILQSG